MASDTPLPASGGPEQRIALLERLLVTARDYVANSAQYGHGGPLARAQLAEIDAALSPAPATQPGAEHWHEAEQTAAFAAAPTAGGGERSGFYSGFYCAECDRQFVSGEQAWVEGGATYCDGCWGQRRNG